jgi:hypothetical protein
MEPQVASTRNMNWPTEITEQVTAWIIRHFARYGVGEEKTGAPAPAGKAYGTEVGYRKKSMSCLSRIVYCDFSKDQSA